MDKERSHLRKLIGQSSHYAIATALVSVSGLISFPIFTRIFSVAEYGVLSLVTCTISTVVSLSKFGLTNAAVRFFEESRAGNEKQSLAVYYSTLFLGSIIFTSGICIAFASSIYFARQLLSPQVVGLLLFSTLIVLVDTPGAMIVSFLRADQRTRLVNTVNVMTTYAGIGLCIFLVFYWIHGLYGFYTGKLVTVLLTAVALGTIIYRKESISVRSFSVDFLKRSVKYGLPLMGFEFCNHILAYIDRYLIQYFLGAGPLGIYSAGYNLCSYIGNIVSVPLSLVLVPLLMNIWVNDGKEATRIFLTKSLRFFLLVIFPIGFGFVAVSEDLISFLASEKYKEGAVIIPAVIGGTLIFSLYHIFNAGLIIHRKTVVILYLVAGTALGNFLINCWWIPKWGIRGAGYATLASYAGFTFCIAVCSFRHLSFEIPVRKIGIYALVSLLMYEIVSIELFDVLVISLIVKILSGSLFYLSAVLIVDRDLRAHAVSVIRRYR